MEAWNRLINLNVGLVGHEEINQRAYMLTGMAHGHGKEGGEDPGRRIRAGSRWVRVGKERYLYHYQ